MAFSQRTSLNTLKCSRANGKSMIVGPSKPTPQWGSREVQNAEAKWRVHKSSWMNILIGAAIVLTFFVLLLFLDFLG